jgi:hypothetical protein
MELLHGCEIVPTGTGDGNTGPPKMKMALCEHCPSYNRANAGGAVAPGKNNAHRAMAAMREDLAPLT